jgi:hypothetical protein
MGTGTKEIPSKNHKKKDTQKEISTSCKRNIA